jgi:hypothetical protein
MINSLLKWNQWNLYNHNNYYNSKIYLAEELEGTKKNIFYFDSENHVYKPFIDIVSRLIITNSIDEADYIFVPHPWVSIKNNHKYTNYLSNLSKKTPLLISNTDDTSPSCNLQNTLEFRTFLHPKESRYRKIIVPYPSKTMEFKIRSWNPVPTISFIGYVPKLSFGSLTSKSMSFLHSPIKSSVYINRKIASKKLKSLEKYFKITCIKRDTFTPLNTNPNYINHSAQYRKNLLESDYVLCPRGFANTSIRFYETLSSGATPILINSGSDLPKLGNEKFWESNIITVDLLGNWMDIIQKDWVKLSKNNNYSDRQLSNQEVFRNELDLHKFAEKVFFGYIKT